MDCTLAKITATRTYIKNVHVNWTTCNVDDVIINKNYNVVGSRGVCHMGVAVDLHSVTHVKKVSTASKHYNDIDQKSHADTAAQAG